MINQSLPSTETCNEEKCKSTSQNSPYLTETDSKLLQEQNNDRLAQEM